MAKAIVAFDLAETGFTAGAGAGAAYAVPNDPDSLAAAIDRLLDDPIRRARMGAVGRARILRDFSWRHSREALLEAYAYLLDGAASRRASEACVDRSRTG
jgi:glycosyltransferase involved in cell wall biosynthesis